MVRTAISQAAFDAIAKTLPLGSVGYENKVNEKSERLIWLEPNVVDRLRALRGPGESYSDVILRLLAQSPTPQAEQLFAHARNVQCGSTEPVNPWDVVVAMPESPQLQALQGTLSDLVKVKSTDNLVRERALIEEEKIAVRQWRCRMGAGR